LALSDRVASISVIRIDTSPSPRLPRAAPFNSEAAPSQPSKPRPNGPKFERPAALTSKEQKEVVRRLNNGESVAALARTFKTSRQTIMVKSLQKLRRTVKPANKNRSE
jgi:DNA-binding NarL/FixJ family response regulator